MPDDRSIAELHLLAHVLHCEIAKQLGRQSRGIVDAEHDLHAVDIEGRVDLVKVAAAIAMRCCVRMASVETVGEQTSD